jgi:hypothetical protein
MKKISLLTPLVLATLRWNALGAELDFNRDIRPILSEHCFTCHGPDANKRKGKLRLDSKESAFTAAESGECAVVPGDLEKSELIRRILTTDKDDIMPPSKEHKALNGRATGPFRRSAARRRPNPPSPRQSSATRLIISCRPGSRRKGSNPPPRKTGPGCCAGCRWI